MQTYSVKVTFRDLGKRDPASLRFLHYRINASSPRVAMNRAMDSCGHHPDVKPAWIVAAEAQEAGVS